MPHLLLGFGVRLLMPELFTPGLQSELQDSHKYIERCYQKVQFMFLTIFQSVSYFFKSKIYIGFKPGNVINIFNPSTLEAERKGYVCSKPTRDYTMRHHLTKNDIDHFI